MKSAFTSFVFLTIFVFLSSFLYAQNPLDSISKDTLVIVGVGDVMLGTIMPSRSYLPAGEDCSKEFMNVKDILQKADVAFCNLEGVFTDTPNGHKPCEDDNCWIYAMPSKFAACLADAGFDLISTANNHSKDFGTAGKKSTAKALDSAGLKYAGWLKNPYAIYIKDSIKYGFCAFSPEWGNCNMNDIHAARKIVRHLDSVCDVVIVSIHGGGEGPGNQHVTRQDEVYMDYNRGNIYNFAHKMIDAGADIIFGHGPHVARGIEVYKNRFIAYSLGNFCTYSQVSIMGVCGLAPIIQVKTDKKGKFLKAQIISTRQLQFQPPLIDNKKRALKIIQELTQTDFPEVKININDEGVVTEREEMPKVN